MIIKNIGACGMQEIVCYGVCNIDCNYDTNECPTVIDGNNYVPQDNRIKRLLSKN